MQKKSTIKPILAVLLSFWSTGFAADLTLPTDGAVTSGAATINSANGVMNINQATDKAVINWQTFNIGAGATVNFNQPSVDSATLNRVISANPSSIYGHLNSNGQVFLINPNGVLFGAGASVDVGALIASTSNLTDANFLSGNYVFNAESVNGLINQGLIQGGSVALIGPRIRNDGYIIATIGDAVLGSGDKVTLSFNPGQKISVAVDPSVLGSKIDQSGSATALNGAVILKANAAQSFVDQTINGPVGASHIVSENGVVRLISHAGTIQAKTAEIDAGSLGQAYVNGSVDVSSVVTAGGNITVTGKEVTIGGQANLNATGETGGGQILVGGDWQGTGSTPQSIYTTVAQGALLDASATQAGDGGKIVAWSDITNSNSVTIAKGTFLAKGGPISGSGGYIETSGASLDFGGASVHATGTVGGSGLWLIDPTYTVIGSTEAATISSSLTGSASVAITSSGDITVNSAITGTSTGSLTFTPNSGSNKIYLAADVTTVGTQVYSGAVVLNTDVNLSASGTSGSIAFKGTVDSKVGESHSLALTAGSTGAVVFNYAVGATTALSSMTVNAGGSTYINANITSTGSQTYNNAVIFGLQGAMQFTNAGFDDALVSGLIPGWDALNQRIILGTTEIGGRTSPADTSFDLTSDPRGLHVIGNPLTARTTSSGSSTIVDCTSDCESLAYNSDVTTSHFSVTRTTDNAAGTGNTNSVLMTLSPSDCTIGGCIVHGPGIISQGAVTLNAGDVVTFKYKATGTSDYFDVYGYLLSTTGSTQELINSTGKFTYVTGTDGTTGWATKNTTVSAAGEYKFVFVAGS